MAEPELQNMVKRLSEAIADPLMKAYRLGGLALSFALLGTVLLLLAALGPRGPPTIPIAGVGCVLLVAVLLAFWQAEYLPLRRINRSVETNSAMIDAVQATAIEMTVLASDLQALAFKHADTIARGIVLLRSQLKPLQGMPLVSRVPVLATLSDNQVLVTTEELSRSIVETTTGAQKVIDEVKLALVNSDPAVLQEYLAQIRDLDVKTRELLMSARQADSLQLE